jgi:hypothetical protein
LYGSRIKKMTAGINVRYAMAPAALSESPEALPARFESAIATPFEEGTVYWECCFTATVIGPGTGEFSLFLPRTVGWR